MNRFFLSFLMIFALFGPIQAQVKYDYLWPLGYGPADPTSINGGSLLDFKECPLRIDSFEIGFFFESVAVIADKEGNLLAYSHGCEIMDSTHSLMENGENINEGYMHDLYCEVGYPTWQGLMFLPNPANEDSYYLIQKFEHRDPPLNDLLYSEFVMDSVSIAGRVVQKNQFVMTDSFCDHLTAVRHANGRDWWIVLPRVNSNLYHLYLLDVEGVKYVGNQSIGKVWDHRDWAGQSVFSPNGEYYARINPYNDLNILSFDRCTGVFSNPTTIEIEADSIVAGGVAFSHNSRYLYHTTGQRIIQYDMLANNIPSSRIVLDEYDGFVSPLLTRFYKLQLAPDGKIYGTSTNTVDRLHVIHEPNRQGFASNLEQHGIEIPKLHGFNTPNVPFFRLNEKPNSGCDTLGIESKVVSNFGHKLYEDVPNTVGFMDLSLNGPSSWFWDFGDGSAISHETDPIHTFPTTGTYTVCLEVCNSDCSSYCKDITISTLSSINSPDYNERIHFVIYPNPSNSFIQIEYDFLDAETGVFELFDFSGKQIKKMFLTKSKGNLEVNIKDISLGLYFAVITGSNGYKTTVKLVKTL